MTILSGLANVQAPQTARAAFPRPSAPVAIPPENQRSARPDETAPGRRVVAAGPDRPNAVADGHRVERPMPREDSRPAPRGSVVDFMV